jgi:hypothetical protein
MEMHKCLLCLDSRVFSSEMWISFDRVFVVQASVIGALFAAASACRGLVRSESSPEEAQRL